MSSSLLLFVVFLPVALSYRAPVTCWSGLQHWEMNVNNVSVVPCLPHQQCCFFTASLNGNNYGCYDTCPPEGSPQCGPDPKLGIQDVYYCYCKDHNDKNCRPYLGDK